MMKDGDKLRRLADWFDARYPDDPTPLVQEDLRRMADRLDAMDFKKITDKLDSEWGDSA